MTNAVGLVVLVGGTAERTAARYPGLREAVAGAAELRMISYEGALPDSAVAVLVDLVGDTERGLRSAARLHAERPELPLAALAEHKDPDLILRAMRAGAREYLLASDDEALARMLREVSGPRVRSGAVISCLSTRGGAGSTTVTVNLAATLAAGGRRVCVLDLDFHLGDAALLLDLEPRFVLSDLLGSLDRFDGELLYSSLPRHPRGVHLLSQSGRIEQADTIAALDLPRLIPFLRRHFDYLLVDGLRGFDDRALHAFDLADRVLLLLTQEIPAVKNARLCVELLRRLGHEDAKIMPVVNRFSRRAAPIEMDALAEFVALPIAARIANDYTTVARAVAHGRLLVDEAPRSRVAEDIAGLAGLFLPAGSEARRKGLLRSLFGGKEQAAVADAAAPRIAEVVHGT